MKRNIDAFVRWTYRLVASTKFFVFTVVLLAVQAAWLALSAVYPLPFDEYVHVGSIQIYAKQWLPFIAEQPAYASIYGDITREPSFLYYWLMSFPYRFFELFTDNEMVLIIATRLVNVAFVVGGLILFRKLLLAWGISKRITHTVLLAFVVTPVIPFLAAHVNYDNLMFLLAPVFFLAGTWLITNNQDLMRRLLIFSMLGGATVLVKRSFLPVAIITVAYVLFVLWRRNGKSILAKIRQSWYSTAKSWAFVALCVGFLGIAGLFVERYGGNILQYGAVWPNCDQVQTRESCADWGPWRRDNISIQHTRPAEPPFGNPVSFTQHWMVWIMQGYYVLFSHQADAEPQPGDPYGRIEGLGWLPLPISVGFVVAGAGLVAIIRQRRHIWRNPYLRFGLAIAGLFIALQWLYNYRTYLELWRAVGIQARYTYPILIVLFALMLQSVSWTVVSRRIKAVLLIAFVALYVWGGGIAGWIIRAPDSWQWQNSVVQTVNHGARDVLRYLVVH